jgi:hypothetical protein
LDDGVDDDDDDDDDDDGDAALVATFIRLTELITLRLQQNILCQPVTAGTLTAVCLRASAVT